MSVASGAAAALANLDSAGRPRGLPPVVGSAVPGAGEVDVDWSMSIGTKAHVGLAIYPGHKISSEFSSR